MIRLKQHHQRTDFIATSSMADIAFLLIIFFMVTTVFSVRMGMNLRMPEEEPGAESEIVAILVEILPDSLLVNGTALDRTALIPTLIEAGALNPRKYVILKAHDDVLYETLVTTLDEIRQAGVVNIAIPSREELEMLLAAGRKFGGG